MSAFDDFVQTELPKRPYLNADVSEETIMIRRGNGPRQLSAITLGEGQVLAKVNGVLVGTSVSALSGGLRKAILTVAVATETWSINHGLNSEDVIIQAYDENKFVIIPNSIQIVDSNNIELTFSSAQAGVARIVFLD